MIPIQRKEIRLFHKRKSVFGSFKFWFAMILILTVVGVSYSVFEILKFGSRPLSDSESETLIVIQSGQGFRNITAMLHDQGVIQHPVRFMLLARIYGHDKRIQAGEYALEPMITPLEMLDKFVTGKVVRHRITFPEGYSVRQIASVLSNAGIISEEDFLAAADNKDFVRQKGIQADSFEGYLYPDTYFFTKTTSARRIISAMVDRFWEIWTPEWQQQAQYMGFSVHEIITLASIIEKETGAAFERPLVSSVFHNRLKRGMRLDSDPTVIYGIRNFEGNLTRTHLKTMTPYNTYQIRGLPPGPIANPGKDSIRFALYPEDTQYLFFVSKGDKTHVFSTNINDHNRAVQRYQR